MTNEKIVFCSGCDSNYFPMLLEWLHSIRRFPQSEGSSFAVLDAGLKPEQVKKLKEMNVLVHAPEWPAKIPAYKIRGREYLKACVCRPFLRDYFPGHDLYVWTDPDAWVQNWSGVDLFLQGARLKKLAVAAQVDRAYPRAIRIKWIWRWPYKLRGFYFTNALKAFGFKTARELYAYNVLQAGVFALHHNAPHWDAWQKTIRRALKRGKVFTAEQLTMGHVIYLQGFQAEILPAWAHWLAEFKPLIDDKTNQFIEPFLPHIPIGFMHVSGFDDMRRDRKLVTEFKTLAGQTRTRNFRNPFYDGEAEVEVEISTP